MEEKERLTKQWEGIWSKVGITKGSGDFETEELLPFIEKWIPKGGKILEGGAGLGRWVVKLAALGCDITGVELVKECVERVKKEFPSANFEQGDILSLKYADNTFDGYLSFGVIEHFIAGPDAALAEMRRVLKPGGAAVITVPAYNYLRRVKYPFAGTVSFLKENPIFRKIFGRAEIKYDVNASKTRENAQKKTLVKGLYPLFGINPLEGKAFVEYRFARRQLENYLLKNGFEIQERLPLSPEWGVAEDFGRLVCAKFDPEKEYYRLNGFGAFLVKFFNHLSPHFCNNIYACAVRKTGTVPIT